MKFRFHVGLALKIPLDARKPTETLRYVDEADKADDGICSAADVRSGRLSQVKKGIRRMPRRFETKKDAISCDKP